MSQPSPLRLNDVITLAIQEVAVITDPDEEAYVWSLVLYKVGLEDRHPTWRSEVGDAYDGKRDRALQRHADAVHAVVLNAAGAALAGLIWPGPG